MFRVTTGSMMRGYRSNLAKATYNQYSAMNRVLSQRQFHSFGEDPAAATRSFRLHTALSRTQDQISNTQMITGKFETASEGLKDVCDQYYNDEKGALYNVVRGENAPTGSGLNAIGQQLKNLADSMVKTMNGTYNDSFVFAGADGQNVPFELKTDENGKTSVYYRGLSLSDDKNVELFDAMSKQTTYVDIGLGMKLDDEGLVIPSSAYDSAIDGAKLLGYGADGDGDPKDLISLVARLGDLYSTADPDGNMEEADRVEATRLFSKLKGAYDTLVQTQTEVESKARYLKDNGDRLEDKSDTLQEQIYNNDQVGLADALTTMAWAQYTYNAALRVGNDILSQSFIDYMD